MITRDAPKNLKRYIKARFVCVFGQLNISIFNFSLAPSARVRPVVSLWLTIVDSFIAYLSFSHSSFLPLCCFNFFRGFPFRATSPLMPVPSTTLPFESPSRIERIPSNYLTLRTVALVCLVEIRQNPAYRNASCSRWQFHRLSYYHWTLKAN